MKEFIMTWNIENIGSAWHRTGHEIVSPEFFASSILNTTWTLGLYPRGCDDCDYLSLKLRRVRDESSDNLAVNFEFSCISADKSVIHSSFIPETSKTFGNHGYDSFLDPYFLQRCEVFGRRKALYLPKDILTLRCRMWKDEDPHEFEQIFGRTQLAIERIITVEDIDPENSVEVTFEIQSKSKNKALMSITVLCFDDKMHVRISPIRKVKMKFSTCKLTFRDSTGRTLCEHISSCFDALENTEWRLPFLDKVPRSENDNSGWKFYYFETEFKYSTGEQIETIEKNCPVRISEFLSNYINNCHYLPSLATTHKIAISHDLLDFAEKDLGDVKLKTRDKTLVAHKTVLCARSPVFLAMLTSGMKESKTECIEINDISEHILVMFLRFLYTDNIGDLEWNAVIELYYAADKYGVELLKLVCCFHLLQKVAVDNICELLMLADKHNDYKFERKILDLISENDEKVFKSSAWKKFACEQENYEMAMKTMGWKYEEKENESPAETYEDWISSHPKIQDDFRTLYQSQIASDVLMKAADKTFPAHKTVLCASSTKFQVFTNKSTDFFEMGEWDSDTVSRMLLFLYTDSLEDIQWDTAIKLYQMANAYEIRRLMFKCSCFLLENLNVSNGINILLLAHEHNDFKFKSVVEDYISLHDEEIFGSVEWAKFSKTNILLANETMRAKYKRFRFSRK